ncbi:MAG: SRPBCC family protein [Novosphingobium sp.]
MIATEQSVRIAAPIGEVWAYASDIRRWANLMPGLVDFELQGDDDSRWTIKVGAGALVRAVKVAVHVDRWAGPEEVDFSFRLEADPVAGGGSYRARALGAEATEITLAVRVEGKGPQAPMWEALGRPLLPAFAQAFAEQLKGEIELAYVPLAGDAPVPVLPARRRSLLVRLMSWLMRIVRRNRPAI